MKRFLNSNTRGWIRRAQGHGTAVSGSEGIRRMGSVISEDVEKKKKKEKGGDDDDDDDEDDESSNKKLKTGDEERRRRRRKGD
jgi:hypothetical protein